MFVQYTHSTFFSQHTLSEMVFRLIACKAATTFLGGNMQAASSAHKSCIFPQVGNFPLLVHWSVQYVVKISKKIMWSSLQDGEIQTAFCVVGSRVFIPKLVRRLRFEFWTIIWLTFAIAMEGGFNLHLKCNLQGNSERRYI